MPQLVNKNITSHLADRVIVIKTIDPLLCYPTGGIIKKTLFKPALKALQKCNKVLFANKERVIENQKYLRILKWLFFRYLGYSFQTNKP